MCNSKENTEMKKEKSDAEEFMEMEPCKNCGAPVKAEMNEDDDKPTIERINLPDHQKERIKQALADAGLINLEDNSE